MQSLKTVSEWSHSANNIVKKMITEHPEYENIANYMCAYPLQKWAKEVRKNVNVDITSLEDAINENGTYFGIRNLYDESMNYQKMSLELTDEILEFFDEVFKDKDLNEEQKIIINGIFYGDEIIDKNLLIREFEKTLLKLFKKYNDNFSLYFDDISNINSSLEPEILVAYHDIEILFKLTSLLGSFKCKTFEVNRGDVYQIMKGTIKNLNNYPFEKDIEPIMIKKFYGKSDLGVSREIGRHPDYIRARYKKGLEALHSIFFGYTSVQELL